MDWIQWANFILAVCNTIIATINYSNAKRFKEY